MAVKALAFGTWRRLALFVIGLLWVAPTLWILWETFFSDNGATRFTLSNLRQAWAAGPWGRYAINTAIIVLGLLASQLLFGAIVGFVLARYEFRFKSVITLIFLMQIIVPIYAILIPEYELISHLHLLNTVIGIMLPYSVSGLSVIAFRQTFRSVPRELEEAARLDGYRTAGVFRRVYLPHSVPAAIAVAVISVTYHWTDFVWPLIVGNTAASRPLVVGLASVAQASESALQWNLLAAATVIVVAPALVIFALATRRIVNAFAQAFNW